MQKSQISDTHSVLYAALYLLKRIKKETAYCGLFKLTTFQGVSGDLKDEWVLLVLLALLGDQALRDEWVLLVLLGDQALRDEWVLLVLLGQQVP